MQLHLSAVGEVDRVLRTRDAGEIGLVRRAVEQQHGVGGSGCSGHDDLRPQRASAIGTDTGPSKNDLEILKLRMIEIGPFASVDLGVGLMKSVQVRRPVKLRVPYLGGPTVVQGPIIG